MNEPPVHLIALCGKTGVGKSLVAKLLQQHFGFYCYSTGRICRSISKLLFGNEDKINTQRIDDALTQLDPSIFLKASLQDADLARPAVIDAIRFRSDFDLVKSLDFKVLRVSATLADRQQRLSMRGQTFDFFIEGRHRSETELDDLVVDFEFFNDSDIADLENKLKTLLLS